MALTTTEEAQTRELLAQQAALLSLASNETTITSKLGAQKVNLGQLPAATAIADTDILLVRQGTTDKGVGASAFKIYAASPDASTTGKGIVELADNTETQTGTDAVRVVTPAGLASLTATEARAGLAEIATLAEANAGTDDVRILTSLKSRVVGDARYAALAGLATQLFSVASPTAAANAMRLGDFDASDAANGYIKIPTLVAGVRKIFVINFGKVTLSAATAQSITFPASYTNGPLSLAFAWTTGAGTQPPAVSGTPTGTGFSFVQSAAGAAPTGTNVSWWIAIGVQ